ncbi:flagella synthesis protein FlgN [Pseudidiomarina insulisalsae]|uniref:Flagellar protein FlgN n=1 Tax=Pseudidiomarina insulisalsae TaxID=575789 RepID=A0A432YDL5_9GAMM|nr:flagellar protein FlgN [Pseudidiomarina insulisalsae]RUO59031.1 flagellar protein FlgN [Pseudidiomarina insulisalsae]
MTQTTLVEQHQQHLTQLLSALEREQQALSRGRIDGAELAELANLKQGLFNELGKLDEARAQQVADAGFPTDSAGHRGYMRAQGLTAQWQQMLTLAQRVAHLNQLNGELIHHRLRHNQQMLNDLRADAVSQAPTYSASGSQSTHIQRFQSKA